VGDTAQARGACAVAYAYNDTGADRPFPAATINRDTAFVLLTLGVLALTLATLE